MAGRLSCSKTLLILLLLGVCAADRLAAAIDGSTTYLKVTWWEAVDYFEHRFGYGFTKSAMHIRDDSFTGYVCANETARPDCPFPNDKEISQTFTLVSRIFFCPLLKTFYHHFSECPQMLRKSMESMESLYCLLGLTFNELMWQFINSVAELFGMERMTSRESLDWCYKPSTDGSPNFFSQNKHLLWKYRLTTPENHSVVCSPDTWSPSMNAEGRLIAMKAILREELFETASFLRYTERGSCIPPPVDICWEPELQQSARLYQQEGSWNVDNHCITALQTLTQTMFQYGFKAFNKFHLDVASQVVNLTKGRVSWKAEKHIGLTHRLLHDLLPLAEEKDELVDQIYLYRMFASMRKTAAQRYKPRSKMMSARVSCDGLQGEREDVVATFIELTRLVFVNQMYLDPFISGQYSYTLLLNLFLPCLAEKFI